jgi:hypothetical protein
LYFISAHSYEEASDLLRWKAYLAVASDSEWPGLGISAMALRIVAPGSIKSTNSIYLTQLDYIGETLAGSDIKGGEIPNYKLENSFLPADFDHLKFRNAVYKLAPKLSAEMNLRLIGIQGDGAQGGVKAGDAAILQSIAEHGLHDFPDGNYVKLLAGDILLQTGKPADGERLVQDVATNCDIDGIRIAANEVLGILSFQRNRYDDAVTKLQACHSDPRALYYLCKALVASGKISDAKSVQREFLTIEPSGKRAEEIRNIKFE